jgi:hypothetical protein
MSHSNAWPGTASNQYRLSVVNTLRSLNVDMKKSPLTLPVEGHKFLRSSLSRYYKKCGWRKCGASECHLIAGNMSTFFKFY